MAREKHLSLHHVHRTRFHLGYQVDLGFLFSHGFVHFPALWTNPNWTGTLPAGTPVAQLWPVPRGMEAVFGVLDGEDAKKVETTLDGIGAARGGYRKNYRAGR